jgi:hypothetical protein
MMGMFSNFFGGDSRRDIRQGQQQAAGYLTDGRDTAQGYYDQGRDQSQGYLNPYIESGQQGQQFYDDLLGINGAGARDERQQYLMSDPAFQGKLGQDQNAMLRTMNARGSSNSGAGALAAERVFQQNYGNLMDRYNNRGQQGFQAAGTGANLASQYAGNSANLQYGTAQQQAGNAISASNALGATRNTGMNNMLAIAGTAAKVYGASMGAK